MCYDCRFSLYCTVLEGKLVYIIFVGYEMIIANSALRASLAIYHLISNAPSWNNC